MPGTRLRVDLSDTIANGFRKMLPELRERIATAKGPEQRDRLQAMLDEMLDWLEIYDREHPPE